MTHIMQKLNIIESENDLTTQVAMQTMMNNFDTQEEPYVGPFWFDPNKNELYGVVLTLASDVPFYQSNQLGDMVRTGNALHQQIWAKESRRIPKDPRFSEDYRLKPRGRVFEIKDKGFTIYAGKWIEQYPQAIDKIIFEFQLPKDKTKVVVNSHWDLGHGWSKDI